MLAHYHTHKHKEPCPFLRIIIIIVSYFMLHMLHNIETPIRIHLLRSYLLIIFSVAHDMLLLVDTEITLFNVPLKIIFLAADLAITINV